MQGLTATGLGCIRGERRVFAHLDFAVAPGNALLLSGANGSGKSSLLRILAGLLPAAEGTLHWNEANVADDPDAHRARLAYIGHADPVKPALTVTENLDFWARLHGHGPDIAPALARFRIEQLADIPARYLSAGQRRRLTLARLALAGAAGPKLWLLDEPAAGLDPDAVTLLAEAIRHHLSQDGIAVIASHGGDLDAALDAHTARLDVQEFAA